MTSLTLSTLLIIAYGVLGRHGYGRALALGGVTAAGAAVFIGGVALPTFYAVALGAVVALFLQALHGRRASGIEHHPLPPGTSLLLVFLGYSALVTVVAPLMFDGLSVVHPIATRLVAGTLTSSNIAQTAYLLIGVSVVVYLARAQEARPELIGLVLGTATLLSLWRYGNTQFGVPFPENVFDNSPSFAYIETAAGGLQRFRGIFSEPAGLAGSCLVTVVYMLSRARLVSGPRRVGALLLAAIAAYLGVVSTSATFVVAGVAVVVIILATAGFRFLMRWSSLSAVLTMIGCAVVVTALWLLPIIAGFVEQTISEKISSSSFDERSGADAASYDVFWNTFGVGVGLGSARASSFFPTLLSSTGLIGTLLFAGAVVTLIRRGSAVRSFRPVVWALVSLLVIKVVAGPDLSDSSGVLWISLGLLARAANETGEVRRATQRSRATPIAAASGPSSTRSGPAS